MMSTQLPVDGSGDNLRKGYRVVSVHKTTAPALGKPGNWYRYTIVAGKSRVTGLHSGTLAEVTKYAQECAESFNSRGMVTNARALTWTSRNKR
jgi:hypothetical protein